MVVHRSGPADRTRAHPGRVQHPALRVHRARRLRRVLPTDPAPPSERARGDDRLGNPATDRRTERDGGTALRRCRGPTLRLSSTPRAEQAESTRHDRDARAVPRRWPSGQRAPAIRVRDVTEDEFGLRRHRPTRPANRVRAHHVGTNSSETPSATAARTRRSSRSRGHRSTRRTRR